MDKLVIGIDYGTDSCRAVVIDSVSGEQIAEHAAFYPRWRKGLFCDASKNQYRQHPQDYIDSLEEVVHGVLSKLDPDDRQRIVALGIDTTGSTPCLTDENGIPLALLPQHADDPDAMFILWKDHTAVQEANEITALAHRWQIDFTSRSGGIYSSEWFWAKALHIIRTNKNLRNAAYAIIEHCDWMPALLTGNLKPEKVRRSRCAAGHKCMWAEEWGGYPSQDFFSQLDPLLGDFVRHLDEKTYTGDVSAGKLTNEWAKRLGLSQHIDVSVGIIDAHAGAIGAGIRPYTMVKIIGTSTCDIVVMPKEDIHDKLIPGICGQVDGSVIPGLIGLEAGQSAFGDIYAWLRDVLSWALDLLPDKVKNRYKEEVIPRILPKLTEEAEKLSVDSSALVANDWLNGRRTPYADQKLKGGIRGLTLGTTPSQLYKSFVEATAFGSRAIKEHLEKEGIKIMDVIAVGGIAHKSPYVMQTLSDIMEIPIKIAAAQQAGALGAAMCAAVSAGIFADIGSAQNTMEQGYMATYTPWLGNRDEYCKRYQRYKEFGLFLESDA
jgi:L-ribulokinase